MIRKLHGLDGLFVYYVLIRLGEQAGTEVAFRALVKDAKRKVLPELTDDWVAENTDAETLDALRDET